MDDVIQVDDKWYVLASTRVDSRTRVLKHGETFALFDHYGDVQHIGLGEQGIYHEGTRYLSRYELDINKRRPLLLNSTVESDDSLMVVDLTTPDLYKGKKCIIAKGTVHIFRSRLLWNGVCYEHIRLFNYNDHCVSFDLGLEVDADYSDIFEVRGVKRDKRGKILPVQTTSQEICLAYKGLDGVSRQSRIRFDRSPDSIRGRRAEFNITLNSREEQNFYITIICEGNSHQENILQYQDALKETGAAISRINQDSGNIFTSNEQFNDWINRSSADLHTLTTFTVYGAYPYAGVPWFSTAFGRDGIITALQYNWLYPEMAKGVLSFLAETQADKLDPAVDAQPGKILHETRQGEMAELGEIPFKRYYGTIDATPLFIMLAGAYYDRTGDRAFIESIWPKLERALEWINTYGDMDGDGYVEYARESDNGLLQQGWKDSDDSIFHRDGTLATAPIALCEVQGYVYRAKKVMAHFAALFGELTCAQKLEDEAEQLKRRFNQDFWCEDIGSYALALDGNKNPCVVKSSNAGHTLFTGIANEEYARRLSETLLSDSLFSGWGIRTIANDGQRYNPMSYHNGSIWPHDNAIIAAGLARYGYKDKAIKILTGLFDASIDLDLHRLPELFCGFKRLSRQEPTLYPVACSPQAWASGAVFMILQSCLGMTFSADKPQIKFHFPQLPDYLERLQITNIRFGSAVVDLAIRRHPNDVSINILRKEGDIDIAVII